MKNEILTIPTESVEEPKTIKNYQELKSFDLLTIKSKEEFEVFKKILLDSDRTDVIKYLNYLRYLQYKGDVNFKYIQYIIQVLTSKEMSEILKANPNVVGDVEDLVISNELTIIKNPLTINIITPNSEMFGIVRAMLSDDFEQILVIHIDDKLKCYGSVVNDNKKYIYELPVDNQEFIQNVIDVNVNTKVNIKSHMSKENSFHKTFTKNSLVDEITDVYILAKKTPLGVITFTASGSYKVLKTENMISSEVLLKDEVDAFSYEPSASSSTK